MAPEQRRQQIIAAAIELIIEQGHSGCTLDQVAQHAGISKPLIYKYFPKREDLLKAIMQHEFAELNGRGFETIPKDIPVERIIRGTVERALRYYHDRGPILRLLATDPAIAASIREGNNSTRGNTNDYFVKRFIKYFRVPEDVATIAVTLVINAPIHSMAYLGRQGIDLERTIEVWSDFIIGGWQALEANYGKET